MKIIKSGASNRQHFLFRYSISEIIDIKRAYNNPSADKIRAFNNCVKNCLAENGERLRIISRTRYFFTVAYRIGNDLKVYTGRNVYLIVDAF